MRGGKGLLGDGTRGIPEVTMRKRKKLILILLAGSVLLCGGLVIFANRCVSAFADRVHSVADAPPRSVALVLGCSPRLGDGRANLFFRNRMECAAELYREGRVQWLLVSGDNSRKDYDEPTAMKEALVALGVPAERVVADYAGFSTFESVVRADAVFGQREFLIVSQRAHVLRALYIASSQGLEAEGVEARDIGWRAGLRTNLREALARVRTVLDVHVLKRSPRFLGPKVPIPPAESH